MVHRFFSSRFSVIIILAEHAHHVDVLLWLLGRLFLSFLVVSLAVYGHIRRRRGIGTHGGELGHACLD